MAQQSNPEKPAPATVTIRPLHQRDLSEADQIFRLAFSKFLEIPDPSQFFPGRDYVRTRWRADASAALAAEANGKLVGSNFATNWGSVGFFGPLTVRPDYWDRGVGRRLLEPTMELFARWQTKHAGLFTFAHSTKHIHLYQKFGFWPRFLTAIMSVAVNPGRVAPFYETYSDLEEAECKSSLAQCSSLTDAIFDGLDLEREIRAVRKQKLGDTLLLTDKADLAGFAVCHCGEDTEAGPDTCYIKFAAVRPGPRAAENFDTLLDACESFADTKGLKRLEAGVNLARHEAYAKMIARGFRTDLQGVAMQKPNEPGYNRPGVYLIDDWR